jgi:hypothetical protein
VLLTTIVTLLRVVGEVQGWVTRESGGAGTPLGIVWLIPVFGFWFGWRLSATQPPRSLARVLLVTIVATAAAMGLSVLNFRQMEAGRYSLQISVLIIAVVWTIAAVVAALQWRALGRVLLLYGLWARLFVVAVTAFLILRGFGTHYEKIGPDEMALELTNTEKILYASASQLFFWIPFTILAGTLFASAGAWLARRRAG